MNNNMRVDTDEDKFQLTVLLSDKHDNETGLKKNALLSGLEAEDLNRRYSSLFAGQEVKEFINND
jgi:hypothetical protein